MSKCPLFWGHGYAIDKFYVNRVIARSDNKKNASSICVEMSSGVDLIPRDVEVY